jgi:nicotinamidase-related amidase
MLTISGKYVPETLAEVLVPERTAHVLIDLQNDCCHPNGTCARAGADVSRYPETVNTVVRLIEATRQLGLLQVFVKMTTLPDGRSDSPAWMRLRYRLAIQYGGAGSSSLGAVEFCEEGSWGAELVDELKAVIKPHDLFIAKHRSSAFFGTNLDMLLRSNGISSVLFTGCTTEGCLESTVRDAGFLDYFPVVVEDGVNSDVAELHEASIRVMRAYRADVVMADEAIAALRTRLREEAAI